MGILAILGPVLVPLLVRQVERIFGPKTGSTKKAVVSKAIEAILAQASAAGKLDAKWGEVEISQLIDQVVTAEKEAGSLGEQGILEFGGRRFVVQIVSETK
jgi:hypothetical protein